MKMNKKTFQINHKLDTGETVEGQFTTKRLSIKDRSLIGVKKSQLNGGMYCVRDDNDMPTGQGLDDGTDWLNSMLAHLEVSLVQKPSWWDLNEIADISLIHKVYGEVMDFETSFFRNSDGEKDKGEPGQVGEGASSPQPARTESGNTPTPVVDEKVLSALDA